MTRDEDDDSEYTWVDPDTASATNPAVGGPRDVRVTLSVGEVLADRYEVRAFIGEGGMGAVYLAFDRVLDDEVALKVVRAQHASRADLRDEVRLAQRVTHRNVCRTYDLETIGERHVLKMEYVRGETLGSVLAAQPRQSVARAVAIGRAITEGLYAAHAVGVVHRDLKPGNVMLGAGDRVVLMDFGLAQAATGGDARSDHAGTPGYMSPEQMAGSAIDTRSDLYALGCVMYEMLVGERLLGTGTFEDVWRRQREMIEPPDVRAKRPEVPRWVARAVRMLLAHDPQVRRAGVRLLARGGRDPWLYLLSAAAVVAGGVGLALVLHGRAGGAAWTPHVVPVLPQFFENADAPAISPDDRWIAYMSDRGHPGVFAVFVQPFAGGGESHQISALGQDCLRPQWTYDGGAIMMACGAHEHFQIFRRAIDGATGTGRGPAELQGDGLSAVACGPHAIATVASNGRTIQIRNTDTGATAAVPAVGEDLFALQCTRDGSTIAYLEADDVWVVGLARAAPPPRKVAESTRTSSLAISPHGGSLIFVRERGAGLTDLVELTLADHVVHPIAAGDDHPYAPAMSADGKYLVFDRDVSSRPPFVLDARGARTQLSATLDAFEMPSPSPNGGPAEALALARDDGKVVVIERDGGVEHVIGAGSHPFFDATGARVLYRDNVDRAHLVAAPATGGGPVASVAELPGEIIDGVGAADGAHVEILRDSSSFGAHEGWRVLADGTVEREGRADGLVLPAPDGEWRAVLFEAGAGETFSLEVRLVPPGAALDAGEHFPRMPGLPRWLDARHFAYCDHTDCHVRDVVAGTATATPHPDFADYLSVGAGGDHWYTVEYVGQVTRHVITNFGDRPWAPR